MFIVNTAGAGEGIRIWVLMFCVEFRELSHLTRDLSQAEEKIQSEQMYKMISTVRECHFFSRP